VRATALCSLNLPQPPHAAAFEARAERQKLLQKHSNEPRPSNHPTIKRLWRTVRQVCEIAEEEQAAVAHELKRLETEKIGEGKHDQLLAMMEEMIAGNP